VREGFWRDGSTITGNHFNFDHNSIFCSTGGAPIPRPRFVHKVACYAAKKDFWVYVPTNGRLLRPLAEMKAFIKGKLQEWECRAGHNNVIIRTDGTLAPCFPMDSVNYDWGVAENPKFDTAQLRQMKKGCQPHCFSTQSPRPQMDVA